MSRQAVLSLLREQGGFVSGGEISRRLGISRAAIWKAVDALRREGYTVEARTGLGYRLLEAPDALTEAEIRHFLGKTSLVGRALVCLEKVDSTNLRARQLAAEGAADGTVVVADCQTAGRGRLGRSFQSPGGQGIYLTALLRPALPPERLYARVLPTHRALEACEALGLPHSHILALQGPFTQKMNEAMLEQYHIAWLVTKDGGGPGGFAEKAAAARAAGTRLLVVGRPEETGEPLERVVALIRDRLEEETR